MTLHTPRTDAERIAYLRELMERVEQAQADYRRAAQALAMALAQTRGESNGLR